MHILFVEDDAAVRDVVCQFMGQEHSFDCAHTLDGTLMRISERRFDCCILDLKLPDSDGEATFDRVKQSAPALPIVVYSASADEVLCKRLSAKGAIACLMKGHTTFDELKTAILKAVHWMAVKQSGLTQIDNITKRLPLLAQHE